MKETMRTKIDDMVFHIEKAFDIGKDLGYDNIYYNEFYKTIIMAHILGHTPSEGRGSDAIDSSSGVEYKTTIKNKNGKYGSFQYHWLSKNKIKQYSESKTHYFGIFDGIKIEEILSLPWNVIKKSVEDAATGDDTTAAHTSFSVAKIRELGAKVEYKR